MQECKVHGNHSVVTVSADGGRFPPIVTQQWRHLVGRCPAMMCDLSLEVRVSSGGTRERRARGKLGLNSWNGGVTALLYTVNRIGTALDYQARWKELHLMTMYPLRPGREDRHRMSTLPLCLGGNNVTGCTCYPCVRAERSAPDVLVTLEPRRKDRHRTTKLSCVSLLDLTFATYSRKKATRIVTIFRIV